MLIEFTVGNFSSFKEPETLSLIAARIHSKNKKLDENNKIFIDNDLSLLTSIAVYGPNASGKSNLVAAGNFMRRFVLNSFKNTQFDEKIPVERFRLSTETDNNPCFFEMVFLIEKQQYRYGFEVDIMKVVSEWLYYVPRNREIKLFDRHGQELTLNLSNPQAREYRTIKAQLPKVNPDEPLRNNALFLSVAAQNNGPVSKTILDWFLNMRFVSGLSDLGYRNFTLKLFENPIERSRIVEMVHNLDLGIQDIKVQHLEREKILEEIQKETHKEIRSILESLPNIERNLIHTTHEKYNDHGDVEGYEIFEMDENESEGTKKLFYLAGPILDTLSKGRILWVDELEARLHPTIIKAIVGLFNSPETNPKGAQLLFTTHDTNLLNIKNLRRDQIWFIDKDRTAASHLYSLVEFKIRNDDASLEADYLQGRYGSVPHLTELIPDYERD